VKKPVLLIQPNPPNSSHVLENSTQPNPTRGWTQPMSISVSCVYRRYVSAGANQRI